MVRGVGFGVYGLFTLDCDWFDCCVEGLLVVCCTEFVVWFVAVSFVVVCFVVVFGLRLVWLLLIVLVFAWDVPLRLD